MISTQGQAGISAPGVPPIDRPATVRVPVAREPVTVAGYPLITYSAGEELANRLTHGFGLLLSLFGLFLLVGLTAVGGDPWRLASCGVYGTMLVLFYLFSTIYHTVQVPRVKYLFRILDHASIFLLIAGTYTPFTVVNLRGLWGWSLFAVVWGLALTGMVLKVFLTGRLRILMPALYLAMGWLIVVAIEPLRAAVPAAGVSWLLAGGISYTLGVGFYAWSRLPFGHAIWHVFVLVGSLCHFIAILRYVVPLG